MIYNREFHSGLSKLSGNDYLILAGTFHGVHAITRSLCPAVLRPGTGNPSQPRQSATGIEVLESENFRMQCFQTLTGTKFLLFTEPQQPNVDVILKRIYELYADFVMKNPFYTVEMPIRSEKFDRGLEGYIRVNR